MFEQKRNKLITKELGMWIWASRYPIWYEQPLLKDVAGLGSLGGGGWHVSRSYLSSGWLHFGTGNQAPVFHGQVNPHDSLHTSSRFKPCRTAFHNKILTALSFWKREKKRVTVSLFHCVLMGKMSRKFFWSGVSGCGTKGFPKAVEQVGYPKSCSNNFNLVSHVFCFFLISKSSTNRQTCQRN